MIAARRGRRAVGVGALLALSMIGSLVTPSAAAGAKTPAPKVVEPPSPAAATIQTIAKATSPAAPGADATIGITVLNTGLAAAATPVTLTVSGLPSGATLQGLSSSEPDTSWSCAAATGGGVCTLVAPGTSTPVPLEGESAADGALTLALGGGVTVGAGLAVTIKAKVGPATTPAPDLTKAQTQVTLSPLAAGTAGSLAISDDLAEAVEVSSSITGSITIRNLGPVSIGGASAPVAVTGLVPPGSSGASATGSGWSCGGSPLACTWNGAAIAVGQALPALTLKATAPASATPSGSPISFTRVVTATRPGAAAVTGAKTGELSVFAHATPDIALTASPSGATGAEAPGTVKTAVSVTGSNMDAAGTELLVLAVPPAGFTYQSVASTGPWTCAMGGSGVSALICKRRGAFKDGATSNLTITWSVGVGTPTGAAKLALSGAVKGELEADKADNDAVVAYTITRPPAPGLSLRTWNYPGSKASPAITGKPLVVTTGVSAVIGIDAIADGSSPVPAGTQLRLTTDLPKGTKVVSALTDAGSQAWSCAASTPTGAKTTQLSCTTTLAAAIPIGAATPRLRARVTVPSSTAVGVAEWPIKLSPTSGGKAVPALAAATTKAVSVVKAPAKKAQPNVSAEVLTAPRRGGRTGAVKIVYGNAGNAPAPAAAMLVYLPAGVKAAGPLPTSCVVAPKAYYPAKAVCPIPKGLAAAATSALTLKLSAASNARPKGVIRVDAYVGADAPVTGQVDLVLLRALTAHATATPPAVTSPAVGDPATTVVLDGRTSSSSEANATWSQVRGVGEPAVAWDGVDAGTAKVSGLTATFPAPVVTAQTTLHLRLTISDGVTTAVDDTTVTVDPAPVVDPGDDIGWGSSVRRGRLRSLTGRGSEAAGGPSVVRPAIPGQATPSPKGVAPAADGWAWSAAPSVQLNDTGGPTPLIGSRARLLDNGVYTWTGSGPEPTGVTVTPEWLICGLDYAVDPPAPIDCQVVGTDPVLLVPDNNVELELRLTVSGTDSSSNLVQSSEVFDLGVSGSDYSLPVIMIAPSISGTADVGQILTGDPGEWTLEFGKDFQWQRCTDSGGSVTCDPIAGATDSTYTVGPEDRGSLLRFEVVARAREGQPTGPEFAQVGPVPGSSDCTGDCWRFDAAPTIQANPNGTAEPIAGLPATITDDGTATWLDPSHPPTDVTVTHEWVACEVAAPASCTTTAGDEYTPQRTGITLHAVVTVSGLYSVSGAVETKSATVDLGEVQVPAAAPANLTPPSINGTAEVGSTLTADPGTWDYAIRGLGAPGSEYGYRWFRCEAADPSQCTDTGVTSADYQVTVLDQLATAQVLAVAVTAHGLTPADDTTVVSDPTGQVTADAKHDLVPPAFTAGGPLQPGTTLTRVPATWSALPASDLSSPEVTWQRCTVVPPPGGGGPGSLICDPIAGATASTYRLSLADVGARLQVIEREVAGGNETVATSSLADTTVVQPPSTAISATSNLVGDAASIPNSGAFTIVGSATGYAPLTTSWQQIAGPDAIIGTPTDTLQIKAPASGTGDLIFRYDASDDLGRTDSVTVTITYGAIAVPGLVCEVLNDITAGGTGPKTFALGSTMSMTFSNATIDGGSCGTDTVLHITDATVTLFSWLRISADQITVTPDGITFDGVELDALSDAALGGVTFHAGADLEIPFTGDLSTLELSGSVLADGIPFVTLPGDWRAAEEISFASSGGVQTIGFHAVAFVDDAAPSAVGATLPTPPSGAPTFEVQGSLASDRTFSLTASGSNLVTFADTGIDFGGSVARSTPGGPIAFQVQGSLAAPVQLATGLTLKTATLGWNGTTFTGLGSVGVSVNGSELLIGAGFSFTNPRAWSATLSVGGGGTWTPASGITLTNPTITGSLSRSGAVTTASVAIDVASIGLGSKARIDQFHLAVSATCTAGQSCKPAIAMSGALVAQLSTSTLNLTVAGSLDLSTGAFSLTGTVGPFTAMPGVDVNGASLEISSSATGPRIVRFSASATVLGTSAAITISFDENGSFVQASIGNWTPFAGAPVLTSADVVYSSTARTVQVQGLPVAVPASTVFLTAVTVPPQWFKDLVNTNVNQAVVGGSVNLSTSEFDFRIRFDLPDSTLVDAGGVKVTLSSVSFRVTSVGGNVSTGLGADARLTVPRIGGGAPVVVDVSLSALYSPATGTFSGSLTKVGDWTNAFGISGLTVQNLTIAVQLKPGSLPALGFAGSAVLPSGWASKIGLVPGTAVTLVAALGGTSSCFGFEIGNAGSTATVLDVANVGAITAKHASIYFAPTGCTVGPYTIAAGLSLDFDGTILSTPVRVQATINPVPFTVDATVTIGAFSVGGFGMQDTEVKVAISPVAQAVSFKASASLYGATATVQGVFTRGPSGAVLDFTGTFAAPDLGGFRLDQLTTSFHFATGPPSVLTASASANVTILGAPQAFAFAFTLVNGQVTHIAGSAAVSATVGPVAVVGTGNVDLVRGQFPTIAIDGSLSVSGRSLTSAHLVVQPNGVSVAATLNIPGVFAAPPVLSGTIAWTSGGAGTPLPIVDRSGATVSALPGDFRIDARNVKISAAGFDIDTDVTIGQVRGDFWAEMRSNVRLGVDGTNAQVNLQGSFSSTGNFDLTGTGAITLAGFPLANAQFSLSRNGGTASLRASGSVAVPSLATLAFSGSFSHGPQGTFFELTGTGTINPGGYNFGTGTFALYRRPNGAGTYQGLAAQATVSVPGLGSAQAWMTITSEPTLSFGVSVGMNGTIGQVLGYPTAYVNFFKGTVPFVWYRFTSTPPYIQVTIAQIQITSLSFSATVRNALKLPGSFTLSGSIGSSGAFNLRASVQAGPWSWSKDVGICTARLSAGGTFAASVSGTANSLAIAVSLDASASARCGRIGVSAGATVDFSYSPPTSFSGTVKGRIHVSGIGTWHPTLFSL